MDASIFKRQFTHFALASTAKPAALFRPLNHVISIRTILSSLCREELFEQIALNFGGTSAILKEGLADTFLAPIFPLLIFQFHTELNL